MVGFHHFALYLYDLIVAEWRKLQRGIAWSAGHDLALVEFLFSYGWAVRRYFHVRYLTLGGCGSDGLAVVLEL